LDLRGRKWQEAAEDCIMRSFITCTLHIYYLDDQVKEDALGGTWNTRGRNEKSIQNFGRYFKVFLLGKGTMFVCLFVCLFVCR